MVKTMCHYGQCMCSTQIKMFVLNDINIGKIAIQIPHRLMNPGTGSVPYFIIIVRYLFELYV